LSSAPKGLPVLRPSFEGAKLQFPMLVLRREVWGVLTIASTLALTGACRRAVDDGARRYPLLGKLIAVDVPNGRATIAHEDIPGFMPAMTMDFTIPEPPVVAGLRPGDEIGATLVLSADNRHWLEGVQVVKRGSPPPAPKASAGAVGKPGDPLPDLTLVDQDARPLSLASLRGRALAITFVFTRCPFPEFCPLLNARFAELALRLGKQPGLAERARLLSVSFDTAYDQPRVLREFGLRHQPRERAPFELWSFATGTPEAIRELGTFCSLEYMEEEQSFNHNLRTVVVDRKGRLTRVFIGNDWTTGELFEELKAEATRP